MPLSAVVPENYQILLDTKTNAVKARLEAFSPPQPEIFSSAVTGFRMRAEFRIWHDGENLDYVMYRRDAPKTPVPIEKFPIACERIQALMPVLREQLRQNPLLRRKLFQVEFLSTLAGDTLVTLIYHRKLDDEWENAARKLADELEIQLVGRSRKQKVVLDRDYVTEQLNIDGVDYRYVQYEQAFTQPNALVNIQMISWARQCAQDMSGDLLELYCGNGNFTLPLATLFDHVVATELSKTSIRAAKENLLTNGISNVEMIRLSAEEVTQAMAGERTFRRLAAMHKPLVDFDLNTILVDPPRAGLDEHTEKMVTAFDHIIYISCNPESLAGNLDHLHLTHEIQRFALFDQFPYTDHMECGVLLKRR